MTAFAAAFQDIFLTKTMTIRFASPSETEVVAAAQVATLLVGHAGRTLREVLLGHFSAATVLSSQVSL